MSVIQFSQIPLSHGPKRKAKPGKARLKKKNVAFYMKNKKPV
jgi:hypothetical protein